MSLMKSRFKSNPKRIVAFLAVFALLFSFLFIVSPGIAAAAGVQSTSLTVKVNDKEVANYALADLQQMTQTQKAYTSVNRGPSPVFTAAEGIMLKDLLAGLSIETGSIESFKFIATDGYTTTITKKDLLDIPRYYYPNIKTCWGEYPEFKPGAEEGKEEVEPILALKSYQDKSGDGPQFDKMDDTDAIRLCFGQKTIDEQTNSQFAKYVTEIQVIAAPAEPVFTVYDNTATPHSFTMDELKAMEPKTAAFEQKGKTVNCTGVALADLLTALNIKDNSLMMQIYTKDAADWHVKPVSLADALNPANNYLLTYEIDGQPVEIGPNDLTKLRIYSGTGIFRHVTGVSINTFKEWQPVSTTMPVPCNKIWTVTFNQGVSTAQSLSDHIYVSSSAGKRVKCNIEADQKSIRVLTPENGYQPGGSYTLWIQCSLQSATGKMLKQPVKLDFTVASGS